MTRVIRHASPAQQQTSRLSESRCVPIMGSMRYLALVLTSLLVACGSPDPGETAQVASEPVELGVSASDGLVSRKPAAEGSAFNSRDSAPPGQPPPMRATTQSEPVEEPQEEDPLYVFATDADLRSALEPIVTELLDAGHDVRWRGHCSWNVRCVHAFWEGITLPERSRLACPDDVPLRRELSVDASLEGEALAGALRLQMGRAVAMTECVRTAKMYAP